MNINFQNTKKRLREDEITFVEDKSEREVLLEAIQTNWRIFFQSTKKPYFYDKNFLLEAVQKNEYVLENLPLWTSIGMYAVNTEVLKEYSFISQAAKVNGLVLFFSGIDASQLQESETKGRIREKFSNREYIGLKNEEILEISKKIPLQQQYRVHHKIGEIIRKIESDQNKHRLENQQKLNKGHAVTPNYPKMRSIEFFQELELLLLGHCMLHQTQKCMNLKFKFK